MFCRPHFFGRLYRAQAKFLPLLLAFLLVVLQTGAVLHALHHVSDADRSDSPALPQHAVCALCVAYAGANGAPAAATPSLVSLSVAVPASVAIQSCVCLPVLALPYQVRAPPLLVAA